MEFKIECPWCNQHYSVDESFIGQNVECSVCEKTFIVRNPNDSVPKEKPKTADLSLNYFSKQEGSNIPNASENKKREIVFFPKSNVRKGIIVIASVALISLCVVYFTKVILEKDYKNGSMHRTPLIGQIS